MVTINIQLDESTAEVLRQLAMTQNRSESDIVRDAVAAYVQTQRPLPKGIGKYHSGVKDVSEKARDLLRDAAKEGIWP